MDFIKRWYFKGNVQLMVNSRLRVKTNIQKELMTASVEPKIFSAPGKKLLSISNLETRSTYWLVRSMLNKRKSIMGIAFLFLIGLSGKDAE